MDKLKNGLFTEGILAFGLAILMYFAVKLDNVMSLLTIPFDLTGKELRWLSLSSTLGNIIAIVLFAGLSLLPMIYLLFVRRRTGLKKADILLPVISLFSFYILYEFINPGLMLHTVPKLSADNEMLPMIKMSFALTFYAFCFAYLVFRLLENLTPCHIENRLSYLCNKLSKIIMISSALYVFYLCYFSTFLMFENFNLYFEKGGITIDVVFVVLSYLINGLPVLFSIFTLVSGTQLLRATAASHMQEEEIQAAIHMGTISKSTVYVTVICNIVLNVLQFLFSKQLTNTSYHLEISFVPLIIAFLAVILSGYFKQTKELYEDNEMII